MAGSLLTCTSFHSADVWQAYWDGRVSLSVVWEEDSKTEQRNDWTDAAAAFAIIFYPAMILNDYYYPAYRWQQSFNIC